MNSNMSTRYRPGNSWSNVLGTLLAIQISGCTSAAGGPGTGPTSAPSAVPPDLCKPVAGNICTVAGTGNAQFDGDGRSALETSVYFPIDVAFDAGGLLYIDDWNNLRIRRVDSDGKVRTFMGKDFEGFPVTGAKAIDTPIHHPYTIIFDNKGSLYLGGYHAPSIMRVDADGKVTVLAGTDEEGFTGNGGPAVNAELHSPAGVAITADGTIVFSDSDNNCIRKIDPVGVISQVAGTTQAGFAGDGGPATQAQLKQPLQVARGSAGDIYVADTQNHRIRRIRTDGTIETVAGNGVAGYSGDGGPATAAGLNQPRGLQIGPDGLLYIADSFNDRIRRVRLDGIIETVVGSGVRGFGGDGGPAVQAQLKIPSSVRFDVQGNMFIADTLNHRIREVFGPNAGTHPGLGGQPPASISPAAAPAVARVVITSNSQQARLSVVGDPVTGAGSQQP